MSERKVLPFKGYLYNKNKIGDFARVVSPPYDVINPKFQDELYNRSDYNFVRVDFAKQPGDLRYEASQSTFRDWVQNEVLKRDSKPAFYFHDHTFALPDGRTITRKGFFCVRRIEDFSEGGIKPHEKTLEGPKADRLKLTRAVCANLSPVFSLYSDKEKKIDSLVAKLKGQAPMIDFKMKEGDRHQVWKETDPVICKFISEVLEKQPVFIADGHHRYETALNFRNECRNTYPPGNGMESFNYVLMYLSNRHDEGLIILPIHRALHHLGDLDLTDLLNMLKKYFRVTEVEGLSNDEMLAQLTREGKESHAFQIITRDPNKSYLISISRRQWASSPFAAILPPTLVGLDVTVMHRLIFEEILRITPEAQAKQEKITYWKDTQKAIDETRNGQCELTFLLNPTRIEDMESVASAGEKMPQKSTFFYPKILSGIVINPLFPDEKLGF